MTLKFVTIEDLRFYVAGSAGNTQYDALLNIWANAAEAEILNYCPFFNDYVFGGGNIFIPLATYTLDDVTSEIVLEHHNITLLAGFTNSISGEAVDPETYILFPSEGRIVSKAGSFGGGINIVPSLDASSEFDIGGPTFLLSYSFNPGSTPYDLSMVVLDYAKDKFQMTDLPAGIKRFKIGQMEVEKSAQDKTGGILSSQSLNIIKRYKSLYHGSYQR